MKNENFTGTAKCHLISEICAEMSEPVVVSVNGRSIALYQWPESLFRQRALMIQKVGLPKEGCVNFLKFGRYTGFFGLFEGKIVPCFAKTVDTVEVETIAAELEQRISRCLSALKPYRNEASQNPNEGAWPAQAP